MICLVTQACETPWAFAKFRALVDVLTQRTEVADNVVLPEVREGSLDGRRNVAQLRRRNGTDGRPTDDETGLKASLACMVPLDLILLSVPSEAV